MTYKEQSNLKSRHNYAKRIGEIVALLKMQKGGNNDSVIYLGKHKLVSESDKSDLIEMVGKN
jgi:hypothetical protein